MRTASLPSPDSNEMSLLTYLIIHTKQSFQQKAATILLNEPTAGQAFYCYNSMKATVDDGLMTWEDLCFDELEVFQIWQEAQYREYRQQLDRWRKNLSGIPHDKLGLLAYLPDEVEIGNASWDKLGISQNSFFKLLRYVFGPRVKTLLEKDKLTKEDLELIELCREQVAAGRLSWRELGVTHKQLKEKIRYHRLTA